MVLASGGIGRRKEAWEEPRQGQMFIPDLVLGRGHGMAARVCSCFGRETAIYLMLDVPSLSCLLDSKYWVMYT